jgi:2-polyprenyl-3-methyl-5-hydroxy-6-metoxy-1,4-benzoquinol methylase
VIDLLVAGGGPAGLATALHGARAGLEVVVVEPRRGSIDKACGEGSMPHTVRQLERLGIAAQGKALRGISYLDGDRNVSAPFRSGTGRGVRRTALHAALLEAATAAGVRFVHEAAGEVTQDSTCVRAGDLRARYLAAADGLHSPIRRSLGLSLPCDGPRRFGIRRHVQIAPPMSLAIRLFQSRVAKYAADKIGDRLPIPLRRFIDFKAAYQEDPGLLDAKKKDPLYVWSYGFKSYHSVFNYVPPLPAAANTKSVLITCGEHDEIVGVEHCRACFERIGGTKDFFMMPGGGHQLMLFDKIVYSRVIDSWIRERVLGKVESWDAPLEPEERNYFEFLDRERANDAAGEAEYRYSVIDRVLTRISNGTIERGVRYFSNADVSEQWRFTAQLVSEIDYSAWNFLRDYLPSINNQRPKMAVVGCGSGGAIAGLLERYPELGEWDIVGVDVDYKAIGVAREHFADKTGVEFIVGDARNADVLAVSRFDLIYLHGILDHCAEHRHLFDSVFRALKPGGRMFYVTPDRNLCTWLCFVTVGPLFVCGLHKSNHDFRRFPRPAELNTMLHHAGFELPPRRSRPTATAMVGLEYKTGMNPFPVRRSIRNRVLSEEIFEHTSPRWWLRNGFIGEYVGVAEKPSG